MSELEEAKRLLNHVWDHMHGINMDGTRRPWPGDEGCAINWNRLSDALLEYFENEKKPTATTINNMHAVMDKLRADRDRWREMARELANNGFFKSRDTLNHYYALEEKSVNESVYPKANAGKCQ